MRCPSPPLPPVTSATAPLNSIGFLPSASAPLSGSASIEQPRRGRGLGDLADLVQQPRPDRDSLLHAFGGILPLRVAGHHDRLSRIDRLGRPQIIAQPAYVGG